MLSIVVLVSGNNAHYGVPPEGNARFHQNRRRYSWFLIFAKLVRWRTRPDRDRRFRSQFHAQTFRVLRPQAVRSGSRKGRGDYGSFFLAKKTAYAAAGLWNGVVNTFR